jgi:tetratricopeptide (TPR) repeat protein
MTYQRLGRYEEAIEPIKENLHYKPNHFFGHHLLAVSYVALNREQEARAEAAEAFRINPNYSVEASEKRWPTSGPMSDPVLKARFHDVMREVGFK